MWGVYVCGVYKCCMYVCGVCMCVVCVYVGCIEVVCGVCKWCVYDPFLGDLFDFLICIYLFIFGCVVFFLLWGLFSSCSE